MENEISKGNKVVIKNNLKSEMERLGFDCDIDSFCSQYVGTIQNVYTVWNEGDEKFTTIDLCVEIPIAACEPAL